MAPNVVFYNFKTWMAENRLADLKQLAFALIDKNVPFTYEKKGICIYRKGYEVDVQPSGLKNFTWKVDVRVGDVIQFAGAI